LSIYHYFFTDKYHNMNNLIFTKLAERYPFITLCIYASEEYVGIIQNKDDTITSMYDFGSIIDIELKRRFIELANIWWWESNRSIPINIFLKRDWEVFRPYMKTFTNKDLNIIHGPVCSLSDLAKLRSKRRSITLVKRIDQ
jgi:hypothetical protein